MQLRRAEASGIFRLGLCMLLVCHKEGEFQVCKTGLSSYEQQPWYYLLTVVVFFLLGVPAASLPTALTDHLCCPVADNPGLYGQIHACWLQ